MCQRPQWINIMSQPSLQMSELLYNKWPQVGPYFTTMQLKSIYIYIIYIHVTGDMSCLYIRFLHAYITSYMLAWSKTETGTVAGLSAFGFFVNIVYPPHTSSYFHCKNIPRVLWKPICHPFENLGVGGGGGVL